MAIPTGFPTAATTGVLAGTALTAYTGPMTITADGVVIENKIINGSLRVTGDNVVIKNCVITYNSMWGIDAEGARNIIIQDCDIVGPGYNGDSNAGILGSGTFLRNDISKSENGIVLQSGASTVKGNYVHDLQDEASDPHYDGISVQGGQNGVLIEGNTIIARDTSNVFIKNDFGPISNVIVNNNYLAGSVGYNIYVDARASGGPITGVSITNNYIEKGYYGYYSVDKSSPTISGNLEYLSGQSPPSDQDAPIITSNGGGASASVSIQENTTTVTTVAATDADSAGLTYSISGGGDAAKFTINATTGALAFVAAPNFEAPTDVGGNNVYDVQVRASDGLLSDTQSIAVTVTNQNETAAPIITSNGGGASASVSIQENTTTVTTVAATDADSAGLTYSISGGGDAAKFTINATTGALAFVAAPNFEAPTDVGGNNVYDVQVRASDGLLSDTQSIAVTVTNQNETAAPIITSNGGGASASVSIQENTTTVTTVAATDADSAGLTYSISGGGDAAKFTINATTGALAFVAAPNFEAPTDVGGNNVYDVQVRASDGLLSDTQSIAVTVTNQNETAAPAFTDANDTVKLPSVGGTFSALGGDDKLFYTGGWVTIDGGDGSDTIDFSQFGSAVRQEADTSLGSNGSELWALVSGSWQAIGTLTSVGRFIGTSYGDVLQGTSNDNLIEGAGGNDTLSGRGGNDTFVFGEASGKDTITDFDDWGNDVIEVSTALFANFAALEDALEDVGRDVLIELDAENSITLRDTSFASVTESDFLFV